MKKLTAIILTIAIIMSFGSCTRGTQTEKSEERLAIEMPLNLLLVLEKDFGPSNQLVIDALYKLAESNYKDARNDFYEAKSLIESAKERIKETISSPNAIEENIDKLLENYDKTIQLLNKEEDIDESSEFLNLIDEGTFIQMFLMQAVQSLSNLYSIREFDHLPDEESKKMLEESWLSFRFESNIECPETIEKQELYLIWARQFAQKQDVIETSEFINELEVLRKNDDLASKDCNQKWADFLTKFIIDSSTETWAENSAHVSYSYKLQFS